MDNNKTELADAIAALESLISKSRVHFYKPIQIAEILYRDRLFQDIDLEDLETYRNQSKVWRNDVSKLLVGRVSTSSSKFQDNLFEDNALPPLKIAILGRENRRTQGSIEKLIYLKFKERLNTLDSALNYCNSITYKDFHLVNFVDKFEKTSGLKRSIDKIYEIVVYSLFSSILEVMGVEIDISIKDKSNPILSEFNDFSEKVFGVASSELEHKYPAKVFRVGITNAADRGLDMWGNFGLAIQIKHISLSEEVAESVVDSISADRMLIVCKDAEEGVIRSLLTQIGWKGRIQSIVTMNDLEIWYEKAMRGTYADQLGKLILDSITYQISIEFPSISNNQSVARFFESRNYFSEEAG